MVCVTEVAVQNGVFVLGEGDTGVFQPWVRRVSAVATGGHATAAAAVAAVVVLWMDV